MTNQTKHTKGEKKCLPDMRGYLPKEKSLGKPQAHSEVVNQEPRVLIIGTGWVGQYVNAYFKEADLVNSKGFVKQQHSYYDMGVIAVPTPMKRNGKFSSVTKNEYGRCDTSIVDKVVDKYKDLVDNFLIKSTVEIGTTDRLAEKYDVNIAFSPEYVGETLGHPLTEPDRETFLVLGGEEQTIRKIASYWRLVLHANSKFYLMTALEAEIVKYFENYWIMRRVDYWNDLYDVTEEMGVNFDRVREGLLADPRLGRTHSFVYNNNRGWGGKCLPKDMNALAYKMRQEGKPLKTLEHLIQKNDNQWRKKNK